MPCRAAPLAEGPVSGFINSPVPQSRGRSRIRWLSVPPIPKDSVTTRRRRDADMIGSTPVPSVDLSNPYCPMLLFTGRRLNPLAH